MQTFASSARVAINNVVDRFPGTKHGFTARVSRLSTTQFSPLTTRAFRLPTEGELLASKLRSWHSTTEHYTDGVLDGVQLKQWTEYLSKQDVANILAGALTRELPEGTAFITITNSKYRELGRREVKLT